MTEIESDGVGDSAAEGAEAAFAITQEEQR